VPTPVICLSHADGAGGREIGELLAERLGFRYVDDGIVVAAAGAGQLYPEAVAVAETREAGRKLEVDFHRFEPTERVRELIRDAIRGTADEGNVVIVAHAASFALEGRADVLRVLVTAPMAARLDRLSADGRAAARSLEQSDKAREQYLRRFYGVNRELPTHYDLVVNTERLAADRAVDAIVAAAG
jgi:cytidylate kinase